MLPLDAFGDGRHGGAVTDRRVYYDGKGGADRRLIAADAVPVVGKDPLFPKIGGYEPVRSHMSLFPSRKNPAQPALMSRINVLLKESGLFDRELGAGYHAGNAQSEPSRARLDVLRVAFAIYSDQASEYRPFLGIVQRVSMLLPLHIFPVVSPRKPGTRPLLLPVLSKCIFPELFWCS